MLAPSSSAGDGGIPKNSCRSRGVGSSANSVASIHSIAVAVGISDHHHIVEGGGGRGDLLIGHRALALHVELRDQGAAVAVGYRDVHYAVVIERHLYGDRVALWLRAIQLSRGAREPGDEPEIKFFTLIDDDIDLVLIIMVEAKGLFGGRVGRDRRLGPNGPAGPCAAAG